MNMTSLKVIVSVIALTVTQLGHAETGRPDIADQSASGVVLPEAPVSSASINNAEVDCLARNIFYEAGGEPAAGKIVVGVLTINRANDARFGKSICEAVHQHTVVKHKRSAMGRTLCQFSWACENKHRQVPDDARWTNSKNIAVGLLQGEYSSEQHAYSAVLYFHNVHTNPGWYRTKHLVGKVGGNIFYADW